ncbi:MAG: 50S ribosomal protein L7/L12 [Candidatus Nealsonbacteria bacterium]|nr:50S ribosomal protein L7/L12 [Candidatus Nealsonbacteria bacterium]
MTEEKKEKESPEGILKAEKDVEIPTKFKKLVEEIEKMSVLDLSELVKILEERFGVSAVAPMAVSSAVPNSASVETDKEEKSVFNVELASVGDKKIEVIKLVRDITTKGLKEAKDIVDAAAEKPQMIKENVKKEEAEEMKKKFEAVGAKVVLK